MTGEENNIPKLLRKFSFVLAFSMLIGQFNTASVYAVETGAKLAQEPVELTSIEIVNLDEPAPEITDETTDDPVDTESTTDGSSDEAESEE